MAAVAMAISGGGALSKYETTVPYRPEQIALIRGAYDRGVTFFDTAEAYGPHECERILEGRLIAAKPLGEFGE